jgi:hypothetical protein
VTHPIRPVLAAAARGEFPDPDGTVEIVPPWRPGVEGVVALTGRAYVATELPADQVLDCGIDGFGSALDPGFVSWLAGPGGWLDCLDVLVTALGTGAGGPPRRDDLSGHRRARHARQVRGEVAVHADERGLVTVGAGIGGLAEIGIEVAEAMRNRGVGRSLVPTRWAWSRPVSPCWQRWHLGTRRAYGSSWPPGSGHSGPCIWCVRAEPELSRSRRHLHSSRRSRVASQRSPHVR